MPKFYMYIDFGSESKKILTYLFPFFFHVFFFDVKLNAKRKLINVPFAGPNPKKWEKNHFELIT